MNDRDRDQEWEWEIFFSSSDAVAVNVLWLYLCKLGSFVPFPPRHRLVSQHCGDRKWKKHNTNDSREAKGERQKGCWEENARDQRRRRRSWSKSETRVKEFSSWDEVVTATAATTTKSSKRRRQKEELFFWSLGREQVRARCSNENEANLWLFIGQKTYPAKCQCAFIIIVKTSFLSPWLWRGGFQVVHLREALALKELRSESEAGKKTTIQLQKLKSDVWSKLVAHLLCLQWCRYCGTAIF